MTDLDTATERPPLPKFVKILKGSTSIPLPGARLTRYEYTDGSIAVVLEADCDATPHCRYCDCKPRHYISLTPEHMAHVRELIG